jgi:O-antigen biosynthesis protein
MRIERIKLLYRKSIRTLKESGLRVLILKGILYIQKCWSREKEDGDPSRTYMDVLFINGCFLPHPSRYRVTHQKEQLFANGVCSNVVFYENLTLDLVKYYRVFIFFRCPETETVKKFITLAKQNHKTVLFDIDDLVIDKKYTDTIKYVQSMKPEDKKSYDDGVERMRKVLCMCDAAITTTERLAEELKHYVPEVFINRNTASDRMVELSLKAIENKEKKLANVSADKSSSSDIVKIGYFSGSITHNDDIQMILPVLVKILSENENVYLYFAGKLDIPTELKPYRSRIEAMPFVNWEKLPEMIASVDINIAPLENTVFNEAKSENKWVEAALVKVPTVASNIGAMKRMIVHGKTGLLCSNNEEWYSALSDLIHDKKKRDTIAQNAHKYVLKHCTTIYTGYPLTKYIKSKMQPNIAFILPSLQTSGGILVVLKHCLMLKKAGYDVSIINESVGSENVKIEGTEIFVINKMETQIHGSFDKAVATLWSTTSFLTLYPNIKQRYYIVQNFETDFYQHGEYFKFIANQTYNSCVPLKYITISKWCQKWLKDNFEKEAAFAPNGLDLSLFVPQKRKFGSKIRILVEGNSDDYYKNVDESFKIVQKLDPEKFEIWFMSYQGEPKSWYRVDKFLHNIPHQKVPAVYHQCHILIKSSILESFSYPPLEMMATGGYAVVAPNDGNIEYLRDGENCLMYPQGDIDSAVDAINRICSDEALREKLYRGGLETAKSRDWNNIERDILKLYDVDGGKE